MSNFREKIREFLKGKPPPPTPKRNTATEAYFSADVPLEGEGDSEIESVSSGVESTKSNTADSRKNEPTNHPTQPTQPKKSTRDDVPKEDSESEREQRSEARARRASDVLLGADLQDMIVMSTMMREMNEKGVSEKEKLKRLLEVQKSREAEREAKKKGDGRYLSTI